MSMHTLTSQSLYHIVNRWYHNPYLSFLYSLLNEGKPLDYIEPFFAYYHFPKGQLAEDTCVFNFMLQPQILQKDPVSFLFNSGH